MDKHTVHHRVDGLENFIRHQVSLDVVHHRVDGLENICKVRHKDWSVHHV